MSWGCGLGLFTCTRHGILAMCMYHHIVLSMSQYYGVMYQFGSKWASDDNSGSYTSIMVFLATSLVTWGLICDLKPGCRKRKYVYDTHDDIIGHWNKVTVYCIALNLLRVYIIANSDFLRFCWNNFANLLHAHTARHGLRARHSWEWSPSTPPTSALAQVNGVQKYL